MPFFKGKLIPTASITLLLGPGQSHTRFCDVNINVTYLKTETDLTIPFQTQLMMIKEAEFFCQANPGAGGRVVSQSINYSHSPFLSQSATVVELVDEVLHSFEGASS